MSLPRPGQPPTRGSGRRSSIPTGRWSAHTRVTTPRIEARRTGTGPGRRRRRRRPILVPVSLGGSSGQPETPRSSSFVGEPGLARRVLRLAAPRGARPGPAGRGLFLADRLGRSFVRPIHSLAVAHRRRPSASATSTAVRVGAPRGPGGRVRAQPAGRPDQGAPRAGAGVGRGPVAPAAHADHRAPAAHRDRARPERPAGVGGRRRAWSTPSTGWCGRPGARSARASSPAQPRWRWSHVASPSGSRWPRSRVAPRGAARMPDPVRWGSVEGPGPGEPARPTAGERLLLHAEGTPVHVGSQSPAGRWVLVVEDAGPGFPAGLDVVGRGRAGRVDRAWPRPSSRRPPPSRPRSGPREIIVGRCPRRGDAGPTRLMRPRGLAGADREPAGLGVRAEVLDPAG